MKDKIHQTYDKLTRILYFQLVNNEIGVEEFCYLREYAIRKLHPDTFKYVIEAKNLICVECFAIGNVAQILVKISRENKNYMGLDEWIVFHPIYLSRLGIKSMALCSDTCLSNFKQRNPVFVNKCQNSDGNFGRETSEDKQKFIDNIADEIVKISPEWIKHLMLLSF